ncbi:Transcription factor lepE [Bienertia sinuspersici]
MIFLAFNYRPWTGWIYVLVTVEPEGFVAIPDVQERESILFNIVCDELVLGIPHKAWLVAALALLCVVVGFSVPRFLPPFLLPTDHDLKRAGNLAVDKDS